MIIRLTEYEQECIADAVREKATDGKPLSKQELTDIIDHIVEDFCTDEDLYGEVESEVYYYAHKANDTLKSASAQEND